MLRILRITSSTCGTLAAWNANLLRAVLSSMVSTRAESMFTPASEMVDVMSLRRCILSSASTSSSTVNSLSGPPLHFDEALGVPGLERPGVHATRRVDHDAASERDVADYVVAGHRSAAAGEAGQYAARSHHAHPGLLAGFASGKGKRSERRGLLFGLLLFFPGTYLID